MKLVKMAILPFNPIDLNREEARHVCRKTRLTLVTPNSGPFIAVSLSGLVHPVKTALPTGMATRYPPNRLLIRVIRTVIDESRLARSVAAPFNEESRVLSRWPSIVNREL